MNSDNVITRFNEHGYVVIDNIIDKNDLMSFQKACLGILFRVIQENSIPLNNMSDGVVSQINSLLLLIREKIPSELTKVQRLISRLPEFFRIASGESISNHIKSFLNKDIYSPLYVISNVAVFGFPGSQNKNQVFDFYTDWHNDVYWTIPDSRFAHIWIPLLNSVTSELGQLQVCVGSHKCEEQHKYVFRNDAPYNYRYGFEEDYLAQFEKESIPVKLGQVLFFHKNLIHRSGMNISKSLTRMTMLGMFHDATNEACVPGTPSLKFKNKTPEQSYYERFKDESVKPFLYEQLDMSDIPPTGI